MQPGAPQLHENAPNNVVFEWNVGDKAGTDAAIDGAEVVVRQRVVNQRLIPNSMETRGDIGWYNPGTDEYTVCACGLRSQTAGTNGGALSGCATRGCERRRDGGGRAGRAAGRARRPRGPGRAPRR